MIIDVGIAYSIVEGRRTVIRELCIPRKDCRYTEGRTYAVQLEQGRPAIGQFRVLDVQREELANALEPDELALEGIREPTLYMKLWKRRYGRFEPERDVWRVEIELLQVEARKGVAA